MHWIEDQHRYFAGKATKEKRRLEQETTIVRGLLKLSGAISMALAPVLSIQVVSTPESPAFLQWFAPSDSAHAALMVVIPTLAVAAGLLIGYGKQLARSEHARRFERMADLFQAGERELRALRANGRHDDVTNLVRQLGLEALEENGDWLILHRDRPLEVPTL